MGKGYELYFFRQRYENYQQIQENMLIITNNQGNKNQSYIVVLSPHTC